MVLHPRGCGRVARRRIHRHKDPRSSTTLPGVPYYTHTPKNPPTHKTPVDPRGIPVSRAHTNPRRPTRPHNPESQSDTTTHQKTHSENNGQDLNGGHIHQRRYDVRHRTHPTKGMDMQYSTIGTTGVKASRVVNIRSF